MNRYRRLPPEDDVSFFREAMRDATPLRKRSRAFVAPALHRNVFLPAPSHQAGHFVETAPAAPSISGHREARLRRGRLEPEARIDLHGYRYEAAYRSLVAFLARAQAEDRALVLVITGKGGVLRPHLPLWLNGPELRHLIIGTREAHPRHGGGGALYVALQRRKTSGAGR